MKIKSKSSFGLGSKMGASEVSAANSGDPDIQAIKNPPAKAPGTKTAKPPNSGKDRYENLGAGITRHIHES